MKTIAIPFIILLLMTVLLPGGFLDDQKKHERVRVAIREKQTIIEQALKACDLRVDNIHVLFVAYKNSDKLELYAKSTQEVSYRKIFTYTICARSGVPGPKSRQGDYQVPEGYYHIDRFNPYSRYFLSLGINYPNEADRKRSTAANPGGDIFIHGHCSTIGCLPMSEEIKEIYLYAVHAKNNGQHHIPVYIFPFEMTGKKMAQYKEEHKEEPLLLAFWENLQVGYKIFADSKKELKTQASENGHYKYLLR